MFETGFCVQFHNIHRLVENSGEGRKRWTQSCQSGISPRRTWLAAIFMRKKRGFHVPWLDGLGTCMNLWLICGICHMLHLPTSSNIYHLHSCTKSNIFAIWIIWRFRWAGSFGHRRPESVPKHVELNGPPAKRHWRKLSSEMLQNGIILQSDWMTNDIHLPAPVM